MEPNLNPDPPPRETCLPWMLGFFLIGFFVLMLIVATGGFFVYVIGVVVATALVAGMHYALWGRGLDETVAGEREEFDYDAEDTFGQGKSDNIFRK